MGKTISGMRSPARVRARQLYMQLYLLVLALLGLEYVDAGGHAGDACRRAAGAAQLLVSAPYRVRSSERLQRCW
eukprot:16292412-Heterocapsa_arctica.AAC.1